MAEGSFFQLSYQNAHIADSLPFDSAQGFGWLPPRLRSGLRLTGCAPLRLVPLP